MVDQRAAKIARSGSGQLTLSSGAIVKVIDIGFHYSSYERMAKKMQLGKWQNENDEDSGDSYVELDNGDVGIVLGMSQHDNNEDLVVGIHVAKHQQDYLMESKGLKVLCNAPSYQSAPAIIMRTLWESRDTSGDAFLVGSEGHAIPAHICVLSVASPVFAAAFKSGMRESKAREIRLPDTSTIVIQAVLECLYLGTLAAAVDTKDILCCAHKYSIVEAAKLVSNHAIAAMNVDNASETTRVLRDFDKMGTNFTGAILDVWGDRRDILHEILSHV
mmetsp:Transcript_99033/g.275701  ORF Transcript_99033/g.275701 Transcript_99033/m.275701 type:complete len:274 (+) Transcript_99033:74-895(+)